MSAIGRGEGRPFAMPVAKPNKPPVESIGWFWHPNRVGLKTGPADFMKKLAEFDADLTVVWNAYLERWQMWMRAPGFQHPICQGWKLLFVIQEHGQYLPLDERVFARLYSASTQKWGTGKAYFDRIEAELARDKEKAEADRQGDVKSTAGDYFNHLQPQISMCGPSNGSKCSNL